MRGAGSDQNWRRERPGNEATRFTHAQYIFRKSFVHLPCPYVADYINQEYKAFFEIDSSGDFNLQNTTRIDVAVSFFHKLTLKRIDSPKRPIGSHRNTYLSLYTACSRT